MNPSVTDLLELADESLAAAEALLAGGYPRFAVARAYYTMFYSASALHLQHGRSYTKHSGVIAGFGRHFVKTGQFDSKLFRQFRKAFVDRQIGDYDAGASISEELAQETIMRAREFVAAVRRCV